MCLLPLHMPNTCLILATLGRRLPRRTWSPLMPEARSFGEWSVSHSPIEGSLIKQATTFNDHCPKLTPCNINPLSPIRILFRAFSYPCNHLTQQPTHTSLSFRAVCAALCTDVFNMRLFLLWLLPLRTLVKIKQATTLDDLTQKHLKYSGVM
jgi:hypothetical protein